MANKSKSDDDILIEVKRRFEQCQKWEATARERFRYDLRFYNGDAQNNYQWPDNVLRERTNKPCLTINKTRQHVLQVLNDQRQNESSIKIRPVGGDASFEASTIYEGIIRHIEYASNAQAAYDCASSTQIAAGLGYWRIVTDWARDGSFNQEPFIRRVADPLSIYLDPDIQEFDGSDARFGIVFRDMSRDEFEDEFGKDEDTNNTPLGDGDDGNWDTKDHVRVAEYFKKVAGTDLLHELDNGSVLRQSHVEQLEQHEPGSVDKLKAKSVRSRELETPTIEHYLIAGSKILKKTKFPGRYIPLVRVVGEETVIDHQLDRKGHVRSLLDVQRNYNMWASSATEQVLLQTKTPYIGSIESIEGFEDLWKASNTDTLAMLPYRARDSNNQPLERPSREPAPQMAQAYVEGMKISAGEFMLSTGQYEANMGAKSNEVSGKAVDARQRQGENSTYHYVDHLAQSIRYTGRILLSMIPEIYDTERVIKILSRDGSQQTVQINPNIQDPHQQVQDPEDDNFDPQKIAAVLNPNVGIYDVEADIGPAYGTQRQETFNAIQQIIQHNESLMPVIGDLLFKSADFPLSDEIAERLKKMVPPQAQSKGPDPKIEQLQQQMAQQHTVIQQMTAQLEKKTQDEKAKADLEWYQAETARMAVVGKIDPNALMPIIRQMVSDVLQTPANPVIAAHAAENAQMHGSDHQLAAQQHEHQLAQMAAQQGHEAGQMAAQQGHEQDMVAQAQQAQPTEEPQA